mmetsp:Transcript_113021/g.319763  ORF Transcript_113021/g.319763 Transcript_113021/m.319763 type:complete len:233 (-) Transcript_113021:366-1064(-)
MWLRSPILVTTQTWPAKADISVFQRTCCIAPGGLFSQSLRNSSTSSITRTRWPGGRYNQLVIRCSSCGTTALERTLLTSANHLLRSALSICSALANNFDPSSIHASTLSCMPKSSCTWFARADVCVCNWSTHSPSLSEPGAAARAWASASARARSARAPSRSGPGAVARTARAEPRVMRKCNKVSSSSMPPSANSAMIWRVLMAGTIPLPIGVLVTGLFFSFISHLSRAVRS